MKMDMKYLVVLFCSLLLLFTSCKDDAQQRDVENKKAIQKKEVIYKNISKSWDFYATPINTTSEQSVSSWTEFRQFLGELGQKPRKTMDAFQKKAAELSKKVLLLNNNIPTTANKKPNRNLDYQSSTIGFIYSLRQYPR
jgi:hypothetical protein